MKRITITRDGSGKVLFETVTVDETENVFFLNRDPQEAHWPTISSNPVGKAPSDPSNKCFPQPTYGCKIAGHQNERGIINIVESAAVAPPATKPGKPAVKPPDRKPGKP